MKKKLLLFCGIILIGLIVTFIFEKRVFVFVIILGLLLLLILIGFYFLNLLLKKTNWYKNIFIYETQFTGGSDGFHSDLQRNYDIVNLGSNPARFAFFYEKILGQNWSTGVQGLEQDFLILKRYHSFIKKGGIVIIPIVPFSALYTYVLKYKPQKNLLTYYAKFVKILLDYQINQLSVYKKVCRFIRFPLLVFPKSFFYIIKDVEKDSRLLLSEQIMQPLELNKDADAFISGWKKDFDIEDFNAPLNEIHKKSIAESVKILSEMIDFCIERELKPVIIIPPATEYLSSHFSSDMKKQYMYDFICKANTHNIPVLDYYKDERFQDPQYYFNSYFLNLKGRKLFTKQVLMDLGVTET
jgi:hypothetical protein